jgi:hypothetical protein
MRAPVQMMSGVACGRLPRMQVWSSSNRLFWLAIGHSRRSLDARAGQQGRSGVQAALKKPSEMQREAYRNGAATFEYLSRAREFTRQQKERGWLRPRNGGSGRSSRSAMR